MTSSWIVKRVMLTSLFAFALVLLHLLLAVTFDFYDVFKESLITHIFLFVITLFVFFLARKINDHHPDYTTEIMLGANASKMLLVLSYFFVVYLHKIDGIYFAYSFLGIYFFYLPFNAYLYIRKFKLQHQKNN